MVFVIVVEYPVTTLVNVETGVRKLLMTFVAMASNEVLMVLMGPSRAPLARTYTASASNDDSMGADGFSKLLRYWTT